MKRSLRLICIAALLTPAAYSQKLGNPLIGKWDITITRGNVTRACWPGMTEKDGKLEVWYQPTGGHVYQVKEFKTEGAHLTILSPATDNRPAEIWELEAAGDRLSRVRKRGDTSLPLTGVRAPALKRAAVTAWTTPEPLFNGRNLWTDGNPSAIRPEATGSCKTDS